MSVAEHEHEPVRGLPDYLPDDEREIWRGEPDFKVMAIRVFHVRSVAIYMGLMLVANVGVQVFQGRGLAETVAASTWMFALGLTAVAILTIMAWAYTRSTVYTLTNKRLVIRSGVAIPMMVNLPLPIVGAADMRRYSDGSGDIMFTLGQKKKLSYMLLWPNIKPWQFNPVVPAVRCLADVDAAAQALATVVDSATTNPAPREEHTGVNLQDGHLIGASG